MNCERFEFCSLDQGGVEIQQVGFVFMESLCEDVWMSVLVPTAEILFFASPKKSIQKKGDPAFRLNPALLAFVEGFSKGHPSPCEKRAASLPRPCGQFLAKSCDARGGMTGANPSRVEKLFDDFEG